MGRRMSADLFTYLVLLVMALWAVAQTFAPYEGLSDAGCRLGHVYDGDTVELICGGRRERARIVGLDTPETRDAVCAEEAALGARATDRLRKLVQGAQPGITDLGHDKYQRRLIRLRLNGTDVAETLIAEGLAVAYDGGRRIDWCERLRT